MKNGKEERSVAYDTKGSAGLRGGGAKPVSTQGLTVFTMSSWHQFLSRNELKIVFTITKEANTVF